MVHLLAVFKINIGLCGLIVIIYKYSLMLTISLSHIPIYLILYDKKLKKQVDIKTSNSIPLNT